MSIVQEYLFFQKWRPLTKIYFLKGELKTFNYLFSCKYSLENNILWHLLF